MEMHDESDARAHSYEFIKRLPKVELHAHLNGCIRESTLFELAEERGVQLNSKHFSHEQGTEKEAEDHHGMYNVRPRSLQDCFDMFAEIPKCVDDLVALRRITREALEDFADHNVVYLELRSTPKQLLVCHGKSEKCDKETYCKTIMQVFQECEEKERDQCQSSVESEIDTTSHRSPITCRLIVSIDRSQSKQEAQENAELALKLKKCSPYVVGVDLGGNPSKSNFQDFKEFFQLAREGGLGTTIHCAEIPCMQPHLLDEVKEILEFAPDRLGHALLLPDSMRSSLEASGIPVECCPTSNVMTIELAKHKSGSILEGIKEHPQISYWLEKGHPFSIGTDDPGVFHTNATKEVLLLSKGWGLSFDDIGKLEVRAVEHAFCDAGTKLSLKKLIDSQIENMKVGN